MTERKPEHLSWEGFAERQIQAAQQAGEFDHLPGAGQPLDGIDEPLEQDWWLKRKLKEEKASVLPPLLQARLEIEQAREQASHYKSEALARQAFCELQTRVKQLLTSPLPSPPVFVLPIDVEEELERWRRSR
ncbi:DnaJ family domain-containing protein [Planctomicrobium piriforme]|uniref:DnaJ homologue subfamily C member 28 conserved domain-containing protein n=1 Tax=Planctomicrobium piriforme TaxID=1576369 RepID=A0A1I3AV72_9PLAN|nr:DUF1992 domain-containing protein [Planctomicrobium piriforme]SFH53977.1 protein of unknown function [Planctomicrobium piriforme]